MPAAGWSGVGFYCCRRGEGIAVLRAIWEGQRGGEVPMPGAPSPDIMSSDPLSDHIFQVPSSDAVASMGLVGWRASEETGLECAW